MYILQFFYNLSLILFSIGTAIAALFNSKARKLLVGRIGLLRKIKSEINPDDKIIWFHAASLGEFEQGRPVIENLIKEKPEYSILLTFFSPSGYEIRKNYQYAKYIYYLPFDYSWNARLFLRIVKPKAIFFIKYEFWLNYIRFSYKQKIPIYCISANFRPNQIFFKWYGTWYKGFLKKFTHIFVQNSQSADLLIKAGITNIKVSGDTRFDRVISISKKSKSFIEVDSFCSGSFVVIAGSTWPPDEEIIVQYINNSKKQIKYIIAPHEVNNKENLNDLKRKINKKILFYSQIGKNEPSNFDVLIIDNVGMLSSLYKYGDVAYIGGGFGRGIHNILEAATYGIPVVFGPKYTKFQEAIDLINKKGAFSVNNYDELEAILENLYQDKNLLVNSGKICKDYIESNKGATSVIVNHVSSLL